MWGRWLSGLRADGREVCVGLVGAGQDHLTRYYSLSRCRRYLRSCASRPSGVLEACGVRGLVRGRGWGGVVRQR